MAVLSVVGISAVILVAAVGEQFVNRTGQQFILNGLNFSFGGANNYYIPFAPKPQVDDLFDNANKMGVPVIRTWAFNVIGNPKGGSNWPPNVQDNIGTYFHYWDVSAKASAFNEGPNGLEKLDYMVKKAKDSNVKMLLVLTNNWGEYGGSEQMNLWYGVNYHDDFFTFDKTKMEYKKWVSYLLNRKNKFTGVAYKDEPAIFAWELINEVRCKGCIDIGTCSKCAACKKSNPSCSPDTVTAWVSEMASYVRSIDKNHLISVGDEGFFRGWRNEWGYDGKDGDHESLVKIPLIDFSTIHTYPDAWGNKPESWTKQWIDDHLFIAKKYNKAFVMEEFGQQDQGGESGSQDNRNRIYDSWTSQICKASGNWMYWMLGARQVWQDTDSLNGKGLYPDYDHYTVYYRKADGGITPSGQKMQDRIWRTKNRKC